jgi:precorrin-3B synthase
VEADGGLARIRLPGGILTTAAARTIAAALEAAGGTAIELTNRANLQLRGLSTGPTRSTSDGQIATGLVSAGLVAAGLVDPEPDVDERRNVLSSPTAGIDRDELLDTRPVVAVVLARLAASAARALSPKFGVLVDGGGAVHVRDRVHDVALGAVRDSAGRVAFEVRLAGALSNGAAPDAGARRWVVEPSGVSALVDAVVELTGEYGRVRALLDAAGEPTVWAELARRAGHRLVLRPAHELVVPSRASQSPVGVRPQRQPGVVSVGATVPLGRIDAATLRAVAHVADSFDASELRVSPWRQLLVVGVADDAGPRVASELADLGLVVDPTHAAGSIVACAGARGCASGHTDTLADAAALIDALAASPIEVGPLSIHVSGCEKGCASPEPTDVALVGTAGGTYDLHRRDERLSAVDSSARRFGRRVRTTVDPATIADTVRTLDAYERDGAAIYRESFAIIRAEADLRRIPADLEPAAVRMVHACGMVDLVDDLDWTSGVGAAIRQALADGALIFVDSMMLADGITRARLPASNEVRCTLRDDDVAARAAALHTTRSAAAVDAWVPQLDGAVVTIGNAPTALFRLLELLDGGAPRPTAIVGVPVGFVGAVESKRALASTTGVPWLTVHGRRGGSAIAAAAINALASAPE